MTQSPASHTESVDRFLINLIGQSNPALAGAAFLLGLFGDVLADVLGDWELWGISGKLIILVLLGLSVVFLYVIQRRRRRRAVIEMRERQPSGKAGLILLLSRLDPRARGTREQVEQRTQEVQSAAARVATAAESSLRDEDFAPLRGSNLEPALQAIEFHHEEGHLRDCWMIGTPDEDTTDGQQVRGSAWLAEVLERWFNHIHPAHKVCFQAAAAIPPRDYVALWNQVDAIFRQSPYRANRVICDVTGGLKLMSVGAALACIAEGRTMQYMATDRDWKGEPIQRGEMAPILIDIEPYLVPEGESSESGRTDAPVRW